MMKGSKIRFWGTLLFLFGIGTITGYGQTWEKFKMPKTEDKVVVHDSRYDYTDMARKITAGAQGNYQKIKAIYQWICSNIAYDTHYRIYTADECVDAKKGVCQAYCELFYQLATSIGIQVEIINGKSKDPKGQIGQIGHSWLFAYTSENMGILIDPTWGAGYVKDGAFCHRNDCWVWFDVSPEWMLLTHFPNDKSYQLIDNPISWQEFLALPPVDDSWLEYGMDGMTLYKIACSRDQHLPTLYTGGEGEVEVIDFPLLKSLRIGEFYTFRIRMKNNRQFALINNSIYCKKPEWQSEGNDIYSVSFMPRETGNVRLALKDPQTKYWHYIIEYQIDKPANADWSNVERHYPLSLPEIKKVKNLSVDDWKLSGIDEHQMLKLIRENQVTELPILYTKKGQRLKLVSVPMNKHLNTGQAYTFSFYPQSGIRWALVNNKEWHKNFQVASDDMHTMTITPLPGELCLYVQFNEGESYFCCLEYEVSKYSDM